MVVATSVDYYSCGEKRPLLFTVPPEFTIPLQILSHKALLEKEKKEVLFLITGVFKTPDYA